MSGTPVSYPTTIADRAAGLNFSGYMQRWAARTATIAGFDYTGLGTQRRLYVPLATASLAGAQSAADFTKLATLQVPVSRMLYVAGAADLLNGAAVAATTWTDVVANQNFTVSSTASWMLVEVRLGLIANAVAFSEISTRAIIDSGGTPALQLMTTDVAPAGGFGSGGGATFLINGLAAGTHTLKPQVYGTTALTAYCRPLTQGNSEFLVMRVLELNV